MTGLPFPLLEVVVTARPSWARVRSLIQNYQQMAGSENCRISLVGPSLSRRYGDISNQVPSSIEVKVFPTLRDSDDLGSIALSNIEGSEALARHWTNSRPDCVLVIADRTETLGVSSTAALMQIPLIHLQGGESSGSIDDKVRDANSKLADFHLTTNEITKQYLISIGESEERIRVVGCPSIDIIKAIMEENATWDPAELGGVGPLIKPDSDYGIIMYHPDTLQEEANINWIDCLIEVVAKSDKMWFWFWPNPDYMTSLIAKKMRSAREAKRLDHVRFIINTSPDTFAKLAIRAKVLVGNSSFGIRESSFLGLPVINIGNRQKNRQRGPNVKDLQIPSTKELLIALESINVEKYPSSYIYGVGSSGFLGARAIQDWQPSIKNQ